MSVLLKCAACGHEVPFQDGDMTTESICPGCEVLVRRRSAKDFMAIPISMELPDSFVPADLEHMAKQGNQLVHRYRKQLRPQHNDGTMLDPHAESNFALAKAIERLAMAIESKATPFPTNREAEVSENITSHVGSNFGQAVPILNRDQAVENGHPHDAEYENGSNGIRANGSDAERSAPIPAKVLVRREAAAEAHRFRREIQAATDVRGVHRSKLAVWVEKHPLTMLLSGLALLVSLVVMTIILMGRLEDDAALASSNEDTKLANATITRAQTRDAEKQARGFLNAKALISAKPYIYNSAEIEDLLERYYQPISNPGDYDLQLRDRKVVGERSAFFYQVQSGKQRFPLVVLQEDGVSQVLWQFSYAIGEMDWEEFMLVKPANPTLMRAYLRPIEGFDDLHLSQEWSCWVAEGNGNNQRVKVFVKRNTAEERRLISALKLSPVTRNRNSWVMGQVKLFFPPTSLISHAMVAEIASVELASWLPKDFESGNTFYSKEEIIKASRR